MSNIDSGIEEKTASDLDFHFLPFADRRKKNCSAANVASARAPEKSCAPKKGEEERERNRPMWPIVSDSLFHAVIFLPRTKQRNLELVSLICSSLMIFYSSRSFPSLSPSFPHLMCERMLVKRYTQQTPARAARPNRVQTHRWPFTGRSKRSFPSLPRSLSSTRANSINSFS